MIALAHRWRFAFFAAAALWLFIIGGLINA